MVFFIKRLIFSFFGIFLLFSCFFFSVSAADLSWKDYIKDVDPDTGTVTISLPVTPTTFDIYPSGLEMESFNGVEQLVYHFQSYEETGREYSLQITPGSSNFLYLGNVPDDTEINIWLDIRSVAYPEGGTHNDSPVIPVWNFDVARYNAHLQYFDASHQRIALKYLEFGEYFWAGDDPSGEVTSSQFYATHILQDPLGTMESGEYFQNAQFFRTTYFLEGLRFHSSEDVKITVTNFDIVFHMGSFIEGDGEYSEILEIILSELSKRGQTLDMVTGEIIRKPSVDKPAGSQIVDDVVRFDTDFAGSAASGYDNALTFNQLSLDVLTDFGPSLLAASALIDKAASLSFVDGLLVVSVSLGVFGLLVNLVNQIVSSSRGSPDAKSKNKHKKGG